MKQFAMGVNVWDTPAEASAMWALCWWHQEGRDYALVSFGYLARHAGVDRRYIKRLMERLELEKHACVNLGPEAGAGPNTRNRWKVTLDQAYAKARREAGVEEGTPFTRLPARGKRRRIPVGVPGPPGVAVDNPELEELEAQFRLFSGGPGITRVGVLGPLGGDPGIPPLGVLGSPQLPTGGTYSDPSTYSEVVVAFAPPTIPPSSHQSEFQLIGEAPGAELAHDAKRAKDARQKRLRERIWRHARWLLEHPVEAAALNGGAPIASEAELVDALKWRCAQQRVVGYGEGDTLHTVARSEWYLRGLRATLAVDDAAAANGRRRRRRPP